MRDGAHGEGTTAIRRSALALALGLSAASGAMALASPARAEDAPSPPVSLPIPAAGMSALIVPDDPADTVATPVSVPPEQSPDTESAVVTAVVAAVQKNAANPAVSALVQHPAAHAVTADAHLIAPRARPEPSHAARPVRRAVPTVRFGWYQVRAARYHGDVGKVAAGAHARRAPPAHASPSTGPRDLGDRVVSNPERPSKDGQICVQDTSICGDSCSLNQLENALQNGNWIVSCILLPSLPNTGDLGQPTPPPTTPSTGPQPQYQCGDPRYHDACCELAVELPLPVPPDCADLVSVPASGIDEGVISVPSAPSLQPAAAPPPAPAAPAVGSPAAPGPDVVRPPTAAAGAAPRSQDGWELAGPNATSVNRVAPAASVPRAARETPSVRIRATAKVKTTAKKTHVHSSPPRSAAPREDRSAVPAPSAPTPAAAKPGSLLGWFLLVAGLVLLAALATASGLDGAAAAGLAAVRSRLGSKGLSAQRWRRARRGIRYRE